MLLNVINIPHLDGRRFRLELLHPFVFVDGVKQLEPLLLFRLHFTIPYLIEQVLISGLYYLLQELCGVES